MTSDAQIRAFIDRILRLKEEQDTIGEDIRDIYAEAKSMGFDKTAMGQVVQLIRKRGKIGEDAFSEQNAMVELYLSAYEGPAVVLAAAMSSHTPAPARARENIEQFDPTTGEIIDADVSAKLVETIAAGVQTEVGRAALIAAVDIMIERDEQEIATSAGGESEEVAINAVASASGPDEKRATHSPEQANEIPAQDGGGTEAGSFGKCPLGKSNAAHPVSEQELAETVLNDGKAAGETAVEVVTVVGDESGTVYESFPRSPMKSLNYAHCFPELSHAAYQRLSDDIAERGVQRPIVRMGDVIVDGWSRYNVCRTIGMEYPVVSYSGNDVLLDVIAWQREARQFTPAQERQIAVRLAKEIPHRATDIMAAFDIAEEVA
ncbi:GapR family DNA-binding domain-containing protein [Sinorhizobium medicae]|uniref:GapR family DNA-binding domain-containing protein n=1 Tax=Sinorhizobium medicae TaxID=110321 RepID=UPI001F1A19DE|nr:GapR family DNA-binding domain-containing protein [Sinorhizobium medicae]